MKYRLGVEKHMHRYFFGPHCNMRYKLIAVFAIGMNTALKSARLGGVAVEGSAMDQQALQVQLTCGFNSRPAGCKRRSTADRKAVAVHPHCLGGVVAEHAKGMAANGADL
jgi:hypothetical protein